MPYDVSNPPEKLRGHDEKTQRQWVHVYQSCMDKYGDDTKCQKMSWGVTGGWKGKGLDPDHPEYEYTTKDPDRDLFIEFEVEEKMADFDLEERVSKSLGHRIKFDEEESSESR